MVHFWRRRRTSSCCEMPQHRSANPNLIKSLSSLATPGMYLFNKLSEYKRQQDEHNKRKVTEKELENLNNKIGKLLAKLDERDRKDDSKGIDEECVICMGAKATMQTFPCSHKVVCRKCFIKTIQVAVSQRSLPLRCVICRTRILKLRQATLPLVPATSPTTATPRNLPKSPSLFQCVK